MVEQLEHEHAKAPRGTRFKPGNLALLVMVALLLAYVVVHSPARQFAATVVGRTTAACYFTCQTWPLLFALFDSLSGIALLAAVVLAAGFLASRFCGTHYERPLVFGIAAVALLTIPAAVIGALSSAAGLALLRPPLGPLLTAVPAFIVLVAGLVRGWRPRWPVWQVPTSPLVRLVGGLGCALLGGSGLLGLLRPPSGWDPLSYHAPLAVYFWRDGNLSSFLDRAPDYAAWAHPGTTEVWFGLLRVIGGEGLANLGQLPFALLGACAVAAFARRLALRQGAALLAASAFLIAPLVVGQVEQQLNDVAAAALLMSTVVLASAPAPWRWSRLGVLGVLLGLMAATKLVLLPSVLVLGLVVGVTACRGRHGWSSRHSVIPRLAVVGILFLMVVSPWWARNIARYHNPVYPAAINALGLTGLDQTTFSPRDNQYVGRGNTFGLPNGVAWLLYPLLEPHSDQSGLGALLLVAALPGLLLSARKLGGQPMAAYGLTVAATLIGWWTLTRHDPRFLLGIGGLAFAFIPWLLAAVAHSWRWVASAVVLCAALFSAAVTVDQELLLVASFPRDRASFYDRVWGLDPAVESLPDSEPLVYVRGDVRNADSLDYPLLGRSQQRLLVVLPNNSADLSSEAIVQQMRSMGARYAYVTAENANLAARFEAQFDSSRFELTHFSTVAMADPRCCFEVRVAGDQVRRYLYRLSS